MKIGLIREGKVPVDRRVAITPDQAKKFNHEHKNHQIVCQTSKIRCFSDDEYKKAGIDVVEDISDCDVLIGVKEVPLKELIPNKTYLFFSHTIKKQPYNRILLQEVLKKKITLIDYEKLYNENKARVVAFGRYAGIVGAYNALWTFGRRYNLYNIRRASDCFDLEDLKSEFKKIKLPPIKIGLTGGGRVAKGAMEVLYGLGLNKVSPKDLRKKEYKEAVFCQLNSRDYHLNKQEKEFSREEFYAHPENFESDFLKYAKVIDVLIAGAYWDPKAPKLFDKKDIVKKSFSVKVIADITCDIDGSIPSTIRSSTIDAPVYDYHPSDDNEEPPFSDEGNITVMAVDNLPCELPRNASVDFGTELINQVFPKLILGEKDEFNMIKQAKITENGALTNEFKYLQDYADGKN